MNKMLIALILLGCFAVGAPAGAADTAVPPKSDVAPALEQKIQGLIAQLGDPDWNKRVAATEELKKIGAPALPYLEKAAATSTDEEVRSRARAIIKAITTPPPKPEQPAVMGGLGGILGQAGGGKGGQGGLGDVGGLLGGLLGGIGGQGGQGGQMDAAGLLGGLGGLLGQLGGLGGAQAAAQGPRIVLAPPTTIREEGRQFKVSTKVVIVVEVTEIKDGQEVKRIVVADDEDELQRKDPEAYNAYLKATRSQGKKPAAQAGGAKK